ncbi:2-oxoglutarate dehydrogenase E1 component [Flavobacterium pectinovorum]|uniref:oxoglutarate dehydrogenase (succinyl-transferring) n=1 Tax=Flavobacterium pectinovorum TaxID=29533 RepID=A0A502EGL7_9FLAO|nr:2-oxoglutarate dehydrogenase E1 component [Flavobacterium pectinovorum]TPG36189.1 2-oxoglutarate dehydrogenase E1 component [Flavobacterium pectinovorum]
MDNQTYLTGGNADYIGLLYEKYKEGASNVDSGWQKFFQGLDLGISIKVKDNPSSFSEEDLSSTLANELKVINLIDAYRRRGHLFAKTNPVRERRQHFPGIGIQDFGLENHNLDESFISGNEVGLPNGTLRAIIAVLEQTYCQSIGVEYKYIRDPEKLTWLQTKMENSRNKTEFSPDEKKQILRKLNQAVVFENFLHTKFVGQKRFSLEGTESLIPALDLMIEKSAGLGAEEIIIGMGHRGRLNVLSNVIRKGYDEIFNEFLGKSYDPDGRFSGDVKYHLGYSNNITTTTGKKIELNLCPNPSHLETVDAVVQGQVRAKIDHKYKGDSKKIIPLTIHGDAALAGQGIVYELQQMSLLEGYKTGGTIHLVLNNQVGFTTDYKDARSSTYCTDLAKIVLAPVFHVNGDDAEAVAHVFLIALEYRQTFGEDVFIDILSYRKYGHNEGDEPKFTQPLLYKAIDTHPNPRDVYIEKLLSEKNITATYPAEIENLFKEELQTLLDESKAMEGFSEPKSLFTGAWEGLNYANNDPDSNTATAISEEELLDIAAKITILPAQGKFLKKVEKLFDSRRKTVENKTFDWAMGELLAYGSLLKENFNVRISGEDVERGTFSHRHAVLAMEESGEEYVPLTNLGSGGRFEIYNSLLSEYAVLGFEYGYAMADPKALVVWEAQFGDFVNTAQVIIDQYIASAETKWRVPNGLVLLLPHGLEGQGPEHSSARIERFLELCADENIQVVNCTTPANLFHAIRRQQHRNFRKPLVVFTPKSLLRHPKCVSAIEAFTKGHFMEMIDDSFVKPENVKKVLFCSGKIYYDLLEKQQEDDRNDVAIVRIEQLYPTPLTQIEKLQSKYPNSTEFIWVQEEAENMGAWPYLYRKLRKSSLKLDLISRKESSSTATGYAKMHEKQQLAIVEAAFSMNQIYN